MRVLLSTWGSRGDVEPMAGLALALHRLGADVTACAPPDEEFVELFRRAGVAPIALGPSVRSVVSGAAPPPGGAFGLAAELVEARFKVLGAAADGCDAVVATGLMPAGARCVAEKLGIRYVCACFHPFGLPSRHYLPSRRPGRPTPEGLTDNRALWDLDAQRVNDMYRDPVNRQRAAIGLPPVDNVRDHVTTAEPWLAADPTLAPWRELTDLKLVQTGAWIMPDDRPLPKELEAFLDAGPPPVYVSFGSMATPSATELGRVAVAATRARGRRVLVGRGWAGLDLPGDARESFAIGEVNQQALFKRVAAVVHHGGAGTTTAAARAGAPQVVVPQIVDQPWWARRVTELGIGAAHDAGAPTVESLSAALDVALAPETGVRAKAIAGLVRTDGAAVAAELLLRG